MKPWIGLGKVIVTIALKLTLRLCPIGYMKTVYLAKDAAKSRFSLE